jgi:lipopolysaccharide export system permease protein
MRILDRYIAIAVATHFGFALAALLAVFATTNMMQELRDVGTGTYGAGQALWFTLLTSPTEAYQLFPAAALIGGVSALGSLAGRNEIVSMWAAGISKWRIIVALLQAAAVLALLGSVIGELVAAPLAQHASRERSIALSEGKTMTSSKGLWARDGQRFINIRHPTNGNTVHDVYLYEFGERQALQSFLHARDAIYDRKRWTVEDVIENRITEAGVTSEHSAFKELRVSLTPKQIRLVSLPPEYLSLVDLWRSSADLAKRREDPHRYQLAFLHRATIPIVTLIMLALAVPLVLTALRAARLGQRIVIGALIGVGFQMFAETFASFGVAYGLPLPVSAFLPMAGAAAIALAGIGRLRS